MKIEMAPNARMAQRGSSLLKLIQNDDLPILDLLVRESVQNSLDASLKGTQNIKYDIGLKSFAKDELINNIEGISKSIKTHFSDETYEAIYISDSNTQGLTGPLHSKEIVNDEYGNLLKLVYEISIPQEKSGSGGSWGLGKTIYFRLGIGLVIYYSRIKNNFGIYEDRLAATMVENEQGSETILPYTSNEQKRGIAWWGEDNGDGTTRPITDTTKIEKFLDIFKMNLFKGEETGTKIIVPFVNKEKLLQNSKIEDGYTPWWTNSVENYLKVALQRWYAPRINNEKFPYGAWLQASVNEKKIETIDMEPFFKYIQALYRVAVNKEDVSELLKDKDYHIDEINLRKTHTKKVTGNVAYLKVAREDLLMNVPNNKPSPFVFINKETLISEENSPIITYVRKPGLIINFETNSQWTSDISKTDKNYYLIGIFVPNSNNPLLIGNKNLTLEDYLRKSEKADHASWYDVNIDDKRTTIVSRIQKNVSKIIGEKYSANDKKAISSKKSSLSRNLAKSLLPPNNFGKSPSSKSRKINGSGLSRTRQFQLELNPEIEYLENLLKIDFKIQLKKSINKVSLETSVISESGAIKANNWEDDNGIGMKYPILIRNFKINKINNFDVQILLDSSNRKSDDIINSRIQYSDKFNTPYAIYIENNGLDCLIEGSIHLQKVDDFIEVNLVLT